MRSSLRFWLALSLLLVAGAIVIWLKDRPEKSAAPVAWSQSQPQSIAPRTPALLTTPAVQALKGTTAAKPQNPAALRARYQLSNVEQPIEALTRVASAILMRNALIDTRAPVALPIPADLRAGENPGAYIVQANASATAGFQKMLKDAGAEIVAYVPNNAFLVKADQDAANNLKQQAGVQSVLPYEPYYKLDTRLMKFAVDHETMADGAWLRVTLFPGASENSVAALANAVGLKEKSPFGEQILVQPRAGTLASLAQLPEVQIVEPFNPRVMANDLTRVTLGVSADTVTNANYLGLSGDQVWVNVNDVGVQSNHPALTGRVFYQGTNGAIDFDGHGTHVAGIIAGGPNSRIFDHLDAIPTNSFRTNVIVTTDDDGNSTTNLFVDGSLTNADFRGIAHNAKLFILPVDFTPDVNTPVTDSYLIETAARTNYGSNLSAGELNRTNETLISNNSWNYLDTPGYDSQAARFDAATRDALPDETGSQPVAYVFAAGNLGFGGDDGQGGDPGTISSPGTAKNVITVGALEAPRFIAEGVTNVTDQTETDTNGNPTTIKITNVVQIFLPATDSADQVASFSSRGNVGIGVEGAQGRFKPDLVAPGMFIMSARATNWQVTNELVAIDTNSIPVFNTLSNLDAVSSLYRYDSGTSFSAPGVSGMLALVQEFFSHKLPQAKQRNLSPAMMKALLINAARSVNSLYDYDPKAIINLQGWGLANLQNVIPLADAAPGQPAQSIFETLDEKQWPVQMIDQSPTNAVATGEERVWNLTLDTNALVAPLRFTLVWTDPPGNPAVGVKLVNDLDLTVEVGGRVFHGNDFVGGSLNTEARDPLPANMLPIDDPNRDTINNVEKIIIGDPQSLRDATGQPDTHYTVRVSGRRVNVKAVNDYYDVTSRTNEIVQDYALVISADNSFITNAFPTIDRVKDVTVNTNVFTQPIYNGLEATNQRVGANSPLYWTNGNSVQWRFYVFTNNDLALKAGFGVQGLTSGPNVAFITSAPLNIGKPRNLEPDIDLYVSKDSRLTNLEPSLLSSTNVWKSTTRLGTEQVVFAPDQYVHNDDGTFDPNNLVQLYDPNHTDQGGVIVGEAKVNDVFYVGVKSEDQQAGEFTLIAISSQGPFENNRDGIRIIHMLPAPTAIPDGTANLPQGRRYYGIPLQGGRILDASEYMAVRHEELGDLVGTLSHGSLRATLNNHSLPDGFTNLLALVYTDYPNAPHDAQGYYNDIGEYPPSLYIPGFPPPGKPLLLKPDGPQMLSTFIGQSAASVWTLDMVDNAASHIGIVAQAEVHVRPMPPKLLNGQFVAGTVQPNSANYYPLDLPVDVSKVTVTLTLPGGASPDVFLAIQKDLLPTLTNYDYITNFSAGGNSVTITFDRNSQPPLIPGEYIIAVLNTNLTTAFNFTLLATWETDNSGAFTSIIGNSNVPLHDNARTASESDYFQDKVVVDATVAIVSDQKRVSDVVLRLTSPQGTSVILSENRGFFDTNGFGSTTVTTNAFTNIFTGPSYAVFTDNPNLGLDPIKFVNPPYGDSSDLRGPIVATDFEGAASGVYSFPGSADGWGIESNSVAFVRGSAYRNQQFGNLLTKGAIARTFSTVPGRSYRLSFAYRGQNQTLLPYSGNNTNWLGSPPIGQIFSTGQDVDTNSPTLAHVNLPLGAIDPHYSLIAQQTNFDLLVTDTNSSPFPLWFGNDVNSQWLAPIVNPGTNSALPRSARDLQARGVTADGTYTIYPDGTTPIQVQCIMTLSGGGWTQMTDKLAGTPLNLDPTDREYLYVLNGSPKWFRTPVSNLLWSWSSGQDLYGTYFYSFGGTEQSFDVTPSNELESYGVGGSSGPGGQPKCLVIYPNCLDPINAQVMLCHDLPESCVCGVTVFMREIKTPSGGSVGSYTNRTSAIIFADDPANVVLYGRVAADATVTNILINGVSKAVSGGTTNSFSSPFALRGFTNGYNTVDFVVTNATGLEGFRAQLSLAYDTGGTLTTNVDVVALQDPSMIGYAIKGLSSGDTNVLTGKPGVWQVFQTEFVADTNHTTLEFFATDFPSADIDAILLEDTGTVYVQPEEPLAVLQGERAMGEWTLEAIDTRTGATNPAVIDDWQLILDTAAPARLAEPLSTGQIYPNTINNAQIAANPNYYTPGRIVGGETEWFYYDVCPGATTLTMQLSTPSSDSLSIQLLSDRSGFPTGDPSRDDYGILTANPGDTVKLTLTTDTPAAAPLIPGRRIFFAVRGASFPDVTQTNETFTINIQSDGTCPSPSAIPLLVGQSLFAMASPSSSSNQGDVYQTTINSASRVEVAANAALTLLASNGIEPTALNYQRKQTVAAGKAILELPTVGTWYFRVVNDLSTTVPYTITVNPTTGSSTIQIVTIADDHLQVTFTSVVGSTYGIDSSTDLVNWTPVIAIQATGPETTYTDTAAVSGAAKFIRIRPL